MFHLSPFPTRSAEASVKLEVEDSAVDQFGPLAKKPRSSGPPQQAYYNPLNEPSPLGLRLRKSPSLLELIQMKLEKETSAPTCHTGIEHSGTGKFKDAKSAGYSWTTDKLKASNFPASLLRIGTWECVSRYEGDLVAKCYFAKHKLVWEVLNGHLKSKIEIQWSDITALKAFCPENKPGTLEIVLARQPLFFKETNPQPRKHTLWQATSDFTSGQASIHRKHFLQCPPGLLNKHFEKLIQCDPRLYTLSQKPDIPLDSPYFEHRSVLFDGQEETKSSVFNPIGECGPSFSGFQDFASGCSTSPGSSRSDIRDPSGRIRDSACRETPSPSSVMDLSPIKEMDTIEVKDIKDHPDSLDQFEVPGLHQSMSMSDLLKHIGNHISGQRTSGAPSFSKDTLDEITQYLLSDSQLSAASDENSLMSRVDSLCCLLQQDPTAVQGLPMKNDIKVVSTNDQLEPGVERKPLLDHPSLERSGNDAATPKQPSTISRNESLGDLLLNLPRIASMPHFLCNIS